jgi:hypothetical protein
MAKFIDKLFKKKIVMSGDLQLEQGYHSHKAKQKCSISICLLGHLGYNHSTVIGIENYADLCILLETRKEIAAIFWQGWEGLRKASLLFHC